MCKACTTVVESTSIQSLDKPLSMAIFIALMVIKKVVQDRMSTNQLDLEKQEWNFCDYSERYLHIQQKWGCDCKHCRSYISSRLGEEDANELQHFLEIYEAWLKCWRLWWFWSSLKKREEVEEEFVLVKSSWTFVFSMMCLMFGVMLLNIYQFLASHRLKMM